MTLALVPAQMLSRGGDLEDSASMPWRGGCAGAAGGWGLPGALPLRMLASTLQGTDGTTTQAVLAASALQGGKHLRPISYRLSTHACQSLHWRFYTDTMSYTRIGSESASLRPA